MDRTEILAKGVMDAWRVFETHVLALLDKCQTYEECMVVMGMLRGHSMDIERLIDDGCYQRAFEIKNRKGEA